MIRYQAIFEVPDGHEIGCAYAKICRIDDGKEIREESDYKDVYAQPMRYIERSNPDYDLGFEEGKAAAPFADTKRAEEAAYKRGYQAAMENKRKAEKSADEERGWVLCSERQPETNGWYLTTVSGQVCGLEHPFSGISEFANGRWVSGDDVDETDITIAWMRLPKPYLDQIEKVLEKLRKEK